MTIMTFDLEYCKTRQIMYFNTELQEYLISFNDGTADYAATEDFNGVDLTVF